MSKRYVGITIGPIYDTIALTSSPAALWAASYMFSSLTRQICELLTTEYGVSSEDIVTPYYDADEPLLNKNNGVGLFHDRIIFRCRDGFDASKLSELREKAILKVAEQFNITDADYLLEYVMVAGAEFEADNPILGSASMLDFMELSRPYVFAEERNPILSLFTNAKQESGEAFLDDALDQEKPKSGKNEAVKRLIAGFNGFQLEKRRNGDGEVILKSLSDITRTGKTNHKRFNYYAIVRSDGDRMGEIIKSLETDEDMRNFSRTCLAYCDKVAAKVKEYGGVAIYSGGDDLLAIMPCEKNGKTVFDFIGEANAVFDGFFSAYGKNTSLSFGVYVAYNKYPLYEAFSESADLLFGTAKSMRNCVAVKLQKHSGQSVALVIRNSSLAYFTSLLAPVLNEDDAILLSAMHKLRLFERMFAASFDGATIDNLFKNIFDADAHRNNDFLHKTLPELFKSLQDGSEASEKGGIFTVDEGGCCSYEAVATVQHLLRLFKFFIEKGEDRR